VILLALDPSSTKIGYAVGMSYKSAEAGLIKPSAGLDALERTREMARDVTDLVAEHRASMAIIETPRPAAGKKVNQRGQSNYGMAVGYIIRVCDALLEPHAVMTIRADQWTHQISKKHRQLCMASDVPGYSTKGDSGGDVSDALGLMQWFETERLKARAT
jgi:Holliday junction resolvasome RuvABC endonuclease subunit